MREKVVPIPFLGKDVSSWLYRTTRWVSGHPWRATGIVLLCVGGSIVYEAQVTHKDRMISPNVKNHLEYTVKREPQWRAAEAEAQGAQETSTEAAATAESAEILRRSRRAVDDARALLAKTTDPAKRADLQQIIAREEELQRGVHNTTMYVRSGQLSVREPHWDIRNNERNWSIMSRDQQQQKDHYWYRYERSKDDDFGRNSYSGR